MKKLLFLNFLAVALIVTGCSSDDSNDPVNEETQCELAMEATATAAVNYSNATDENHAQVCNAYRVALENQIEVCGDADGSLQAIIDLLADCSTPVDCEIAATATATAAANYSNATAENHAQACNAYKAALQNQIAACGDESGILQAMINDLGDCAAPGEVSGTLTVTAGSMPINFTDLNVVNEGGVVKVSGTSSTGTYTIYFEVAENETGEDILENFEIKLVSVHHPYEGFTSNVTVNNDGTLTGTFHGIVVNDDNGMVELTSGNISLEY